jgi:hypothetical protein
MTRDGLGLPCPRPWAIGMGAKAGSTRWDNLTMS